MKSCFLSLLSFHPRIQSLHINYTYTNNCGVGVQGGPSVDVIKGLLRVYEKLNKQEKKGLDFCPPATSLRGQEASTVVTKTGEFPVWAGIQVFGSFQFSALVSSFCVFSTTWWTFALQFLPHILLLVPMNKLSFVKSNSFSPGGNNKMHLFQIKPLT